DLMELSEEQREETIPSGQKKFENRIGWGVSFLTNVGALERPRRANYAITDAGRELCSRFPSGATVRDIRELGDDPSYLIRTYKKSERASANTTEVSEAPESLTPIEQIESGIERIREEVSIELLSKLQGKEPGFFEEAVVELLLAMGYGGTSGAGAVTKMSNDGGI